MPNIRLLPPPVESFSCAPSIEDMPKKTTLADEIAPIFAERLQNSIQQAGISQAELGRQLGAERSTVNGWIKGRKLPSVENLLRISQITRQPVSYLLPDKLHGRDSLEYLSRALGTKIGGNRLRALLQVPKPALLAAIDSLVGKAVASGAIALNSNGNG